MILDQLFEDPRSRRLSAVEKLQRAIERERARNPRPGTSHLDRLLAAQRAADAAKRRDLAEFAPDSGDDGGDDGFSEETLRQLAAQWYMGDEDPKVEKILMAAGWEIGHDEGYDDEPGVFVVQAGDINGHSFISWPANELREGMAEGYTGRETKDGTWRVFKDGKAVAAAGPFKSREEAAAWIKKQKTGVAEGWSDYDDNQYSLTDSTGKELTLLRGNTPEEAIERAKQLIGSNEKLLATFGLVKLTPRPHYIVRNAKRQGVAEATGNPGMPHDFTAVQPGAEVWYKGRFAGWTTGKVYDDPYGKHGKMVAFDPNPSEFPGDQGRVLSLPYDEVSLRKSTSIGKLKGPEQGMAEGRFDEPLTGWHIVYRNSGNPVHATPSFESKEQAQKYLMTKMFANHQDYKVVHTAGVGVAEGTESSIQKKIQAKQDSLSLAREQRRARGQRQQGPREIKLQAEIDRLNTELTQLKKQGVAEGKEEMVQIEYWQQETMESGRWVKTKPIPRATAEKIVNSFERGEIVDVEQGVAEGSREHGSAYDRGAADSWYGRPYNPQKYSDAAAQAEYKAGYDENESQASMRKDYDDDHDLDQGDDELREDRSMSVEVITKDGRRERRQVRLSSTTRDPIRAIMSYYARQGMELYSVDGRRVGAGALAEKKDACYNKVRSRYKVWPSAYASGALVQCRKKGADNWGTGGKKK